MIELLSKNIILAKSQVSTYINYNSNFTKAIILLNCINQNKFVQFPTNDV